MDQGFKENECYISRSVKLRINCNVRNTTLDIHYITEKSNTSVKSKLYQGAVIVCLCNVDFKNCKIKITVDKDYYISSFQDSVNLVTVTIDGRYWYQRITNTPPYEARKHAIHYPDKSTKWLLQVTSSCKCMLNLELDVVCNLLEQVLNEGTEVGAYSVKEFKKVLKAHLFQKHYEKWYDRDQQIRNERKLSWNKESGKLSQDIIEILNITGQNTWTLDKVFTSDFLIYFSPGLVEYKLNNHPFVYEYVG